MGSEAEDTEHTQGAEYAWAWARCGKRGRWEAGDEERVDEGEDERERG